MIRPSIARGALAACVAATAAVAGQAAEQEVRVSGGDCALVHLVARDAPLSRVLAQLSQALGFKVSFAADNDPLVTVDVSRTPSDLITHLAPTANLSLMQARNPRCPDTEKIVQVWVLPSGPGGAVRTAMVPDAQPARPTQTGARPKSAAPPIPGPPKPDAPVPVQPASDDAFLRTHGLPGAEPHRLGGEPGNPDHP